MMFDMKTTFKYLLAAACAAPMILSGCQREVEFDTPAKINVRIADNDPQTRTSYDNLEGKFTWNEGDEIAIHYQGGKYETYAVSPNSDPTTGSVISSSVGGKVRNDFAIYPASAAVVTADGAAPKVNFPAEYDLTALSGVDATYAPALLLAANVPDEDLAFYHAGGLVRFILTDLAATTTKIVVTFDKNVTGEFDVVTNDTDEPIPYVETAEGSNTAVTFTLTSAEINTDGSLELNLPVPCGTYEWARVEIYAGDTKLTTLEHSAPLEFARHHGKRVAFVETEVELFIGDNSDPTTTELGQIKLPEGFTGTPTLTNNGGILTLSPAFVSYKTDGDKMEAVPIKFRYSTNGTRWQDLPDWISPAGTVDLNGSLPDFPQELAIVIDPLPNEIPLTAFGVPMPAGSRTANLQNTRAVTGVVDLSTINVATGENIDMTTANCYVVNAPGTYTFPFVYGNGVKDGDVNEPAFHAMQKNGDTYEYRPDEETAYSNQAKAHLLGRFKDHNGNNIMYPYIAQQLGEANYEAKVLWMDQPGLIESVQYDAAGAGPKDDRIQFVVSEDGISQGNALIGVLDENGTIVWSWHIWVTDENLTAHKTLQGAEMSPVNIGWCNQVMISKYTRKTFYIQVIQDYPGARMDNTFNRVKIVLGTTGSTTLYGNNTYYQPGRKDPIPGFDGDKSVVGDKKVYPSRSENPYYPQYSILDLATLPGTIQHPYIHYYPEAGRTPTRWMDVTYGNSWNSTQTIFGSAADQCADPDPVTKTIYDPSPVGYRLPGPALFYGLTFDELEATGEKNAPDGIRLYTVTEASGKDNAVFVAMGRREKYIRYLNSHHLYYFTSNGYYNSSRFLALDFYRYEPTRQNRISSISDMCSILPTVDE